MRRFKFLIAVLFLVFAGNLFSQIYPVQLSAQLIPPYSGYLPDYADPSSEKLKIILQFNDFTTPQYNIRLKIEIKGNGFTLVTKQLFNPPPINLQSGVPLLLSGADLAPYLNSNNLDFIGINQAQYEQRMALPEGYYSVCVKAYDYYNPGNIQVSNESCSQAWFMLSDPPFLNLPQCGKYVTPQNPQNILFQWTPMNLSSPNSAANTEYEFALWEVRPDSSVNPNQIVLSTAPIFSTTTNLTVLNYGISEPPLNLYMKYVWRVRAKDITGRDWFKNNGASQICTFVYGSIQSVLGNALNLSLSAQGVTHRLGTCSWNTQNIYTKYLLQVRKSGTQNWFDYNCNTGFEKVTNLEPNTSYEARVRGEGNSITGDWSNIATFNTTSEPNYSCNDQTQYADVLAAQPLPSSKAIAGLLIQSGQFEVITTQINPSGPPGWYSGKGYAKVFGALPLAVQFNNIYIDDNNRHQQGVIQALTRGIDAWTHQWDVKDAEEHASYVNGTVENVYVNGNQICVKIQGHATDSCFDFPPNQNVIVVRDDNGNQWIVNVNPPSVSGPTNYYQLSSDELDASDSTIVVFEQSPDQKYGFDKKQYTAWANNYEIIKLKSGKNYFVPHKSVSEFQSDGVYAAINIIGFTAGKLSFKTTAGLQLTAVVQGNPNLYKVTVPHQANGVYAWYDGKKVGKLDVVSLKPLTKKLVIVPIGNVSAPNNLQSDLNKIFQQASVTWSVTVKPSFTFNLGNDGLKSADATLMSKYSDEMRALRDAYKQANTDYDKEAYYVFVVGNFDDPSIKGYMVRGRALGFVASTSSATDMARVVAHELAHGAFGLEHTFPAIGKNTSDNLLDYGAGTELGAKQWEEMQTRPPLFNWLDTEEDASYFNSLLLSESTFLNYDFKETNPYFDKAAELFADILRKSSCYSIKLNRSNQFFTTVSGTAFFFGNEIYIEHTFNYYTRFDNDIDFLMDWGLDFYDLQVDLNSNWKQKIYFYLSKGEEKWKHSKNPPLLIDLLARVVTGVPTAIYGYASGKDMFDGHTLSSAEHALNLLEIVPVTMIGSKVLKGVKSIKVGQKVLDLSAGVFNKSKEEIKKLAQQALESAGSILNALSSTLKGIHNRLISAGIKHIVQGNIVKYLTKNGEELARIENGTFIVTKPKANLPSPISYLDEVFITKHVNKFKSEGGAFVIRKRDIIGNPNYQTLAPGKFVGLKGEMDVVVGKYNDAGQNTQVLVDELELGNGYFKPDDEVFYVTVKKEKGFTFDFPTGKEIGAYEGFWVPGGYTKQGTSEAIISNSGSFAHNNNWQTFVNLFGSENVTKIK